MPVTNELALIAAKLRLVILETALKAKKGHVPPAYSCLDLVVALFQGGLLNIDPKSPKNPNRDRFILSKGHACLSLYAVMAEKGFFNQSELNTFAGDGAFLPGHPDLEIPGIEAISGSLGHGLGLGCGMSIASRLDDADWKTVVILGDGECQEGAIWEAAMFAGQQQLNNLTAIVDYNKLGATNFMDNVISMEPFAERWKSFGWECIEINGHDYDEIIAAYKKTRNDKPRVIIAHTIKGKGVEFMENSPLWHHQLPKDEQIIQAINTLQAEISLLAGEKENDL